MNNIEKWKTIKMKYDALNSQFKFYGLLISILSSIASLIYFLFFN